MNRGIDISLVQTFHQERGLARLTLPNMARMLACAEAMGLATEHVRVLDRPDAETDRHVVEGLRRQDRILRCDHGDSAASRNSGIAAARGRIIAIVDGDDYYSDIYLVEAIRRLRGHEDTCVVHPELVISFGATRTIRRHVDQVEDAFPIETCFVLNPWASCVVAARAAFEACPYVSTHVRQTGFGYEDWHWNMEVMAAGYCHTVARRTALYYRRRSNSVLKRESAAGAVVRPTRFHAPGFVPA